MNELIPYSNESDYEDKMTKTLKGIESYYLCQQGAPSFFVGQ